MPQRNLDAPPVLDFPSQLKTRIDIHGPLCVGIDPSAALLALCGLPDSPEGAFELGKRLLEAAAYQLAIVKPQAAYFERFGSAGWRALEALVALAREKEVLVLLDAKRGDIDTTAEAYAEAYFSPASPLKVDALTLQPFLGLGALRKAFEFCVAHGAGAFVVVRSSNPEGERIQTARLANGATVAEALCQEITAANRAFTGEVIGPIGAVVGATCHDGDTMAKALPLSYILAPGVGAQGATFADLRARMSAARGRILPSVSRALLADGASTTALRETLRRLRAHARDLVG